MAEATAFPEGDPRNARYFENLAALEHGYEHSLGEYAEQRQNAKTNAEYGLGQIAKGEPEGFRNVRNRANATGLLHSGILGGRTDSLASQYAAKRYGITHGLQEREGGITRSEQRAKEDYENSKTRAANSAREEYRQAIEKNPGSLITNPALKAEAEGKPPPAPAATAAPPSAGGHTVQGKYVTGPKGERVYQAWSRAPAARKVVGGKYVTKTVNGKPTRVYQAWT